MQDPSRHQPWTKGVPWGPLLPGVISLVLEYVAGTEITQSLQSPPMWSQTVNQGPLMTGWAKWEAPQLPSSSDKIINWRNYWHILDKTAKISATLPAHRMESKCPCPAANVKVISAMTLDEHLLTQLATQTVVSLPEVVLLLERVTLPLTLGWGYSLSKYILPHHHMVGAISL